MCNKKSLIVVLTMEWEERLVSAVNSYISSGQNDTMSTCVEQLETGRVKLVDFVSILRDALTSNVVAERRRGIQLLTEVITALPQTFCSDAEVTLLMEFFCARLSDHHSVVPLCLAGIAKLLHCGTLGSKDIIYAVRAVFSDVIVQTLVQSDRMLIYEMFQHLLSDRLSDLRGITAEFICGFVQAIDSEKEPRNLLMCLSLVEIVAKEFKLDGTLAEQLFEIVACYYPIDFSPPAGVMSTVTKEQLSTALMNAMTASPLFGSFCLPLLLEKLSSNVTSAKMDSLQMLVHCCNIFRQKDIDEHSVELWNCIKSDVFAQHSVIQDEALYALTTLVKCLSNGMDNYESRSKQCNKFVTVILGDCGKYLYDAEQVACKQAGKLLSATCQGSSEACHMVMQFAMPVIVTEFHRHTGTQSLARQNLLDVLKALLVAANNVSINSNNLSPVTDYKESVTDIYVSLLISTDPALRCHAVSGIARLVVLPFLLKTHESNLLMQHLLNILLSDSEPSVIQESVANATLVALKQPGVICHIFLPVLTRILNGSKDDIELGQHVDAVFIVQLLSTISVHSVVTIETIPILFSYISSLTQNSDCALNEFHQCCVCLTSIVTVMSSDCSEYFVNWLAPKCVALTLHICTTSQSTLHAHQLVTELAVVVHNVVQRETETNLSTFVLSLLSTFLHGDKVKYHEHTDLAIADFIPLGVNFPGEQVCSLALLTAVVCSSCNLIELSLLDELMTLLVDLILQSADEVVHVCACKCLSGLVNRRPQNAFLDAKLQTLQSAIEAEIYAKEVSKLSKKKAMTLCIWITKSLVMRNHAKQMGFLKFLVDTLADSELASSAADGFKFVLSDDNELTDAVFSSASGATRTTMYKQRFFTMSLPLLLADHQNASSEMKRSYVMALLQLMQFVPQQVLIPEIPQLLPVLLQSLNSEEPLTWLITLDTLTELISDNSEVFQSYVDDLVPRVLALSAYSPMMKVRIAAVRCISEFSVMPVHLLLPHQHKVLQQLSSTIDDHKRLVRQEAAVARSRWFLIGSSDK